MSQHKTEYKKYLKVPQPKGNGYVMTFEVNKTTGCDRLTATACPKKMQWYGYETIGPRIYALYRCPEHGIKRDRL